MKKIIALTLSLMLLFGCVSAVAETAEKGTVTMIKAFTIEYDQIPDGYKLSLPTVNTELEYSALIQSPEADKPTMVLIMLFSDEWEGVNTLADAAAEEIEEVKQSFYDVLEFDDGDLFFETAQTDEGLPLLVVKSVDGSFGAVYMIYQSHEIEIDILPTGEADAVTDELINSLITFVASVKFVPAEQ